MDGIPEPERVSGVRKDEDDDPRRRERQIEAIRRGDADAFERIAREQAPRLFRVAIRLERRREDAEDLVQETLVRSLPKLKGFEGRSALSTYLFRAMQNLWKNRLRSRSRARVIAVDFERDGSDGGRPVVEATSEGPSPLERLESRERAASVRRAIERLEPMRKLTLLLREVEEMSYEEIAGVTGVPVGTVRSRLARARDDLRGLLGETP